MAAPTTRDQRGERAGWGNLYLFVVIFLPLTILVDVDTDLKLPIPPPPNAVDENEVMPPWPREPKDGNPVGGEERGEAGPPAAVTHGSRTVAATPGGPAGAWVGGEAAPAHSPAGPGLPPGLVHHGGTRTGPCISIPQENRHCHRTASPTC